METVYQIITGKRQFCNHTGKKERFRPEAFFLFAYIPSMGRLVSVEKLELEYSTST